MRPLLLAACIAIATTLTGCASVNIGSAASVEGVLANPARSSADRERDKREGDHA